MDDAFKTLVTIPGFEHLKESDVSFQRQGGLTNLVYRTETPDGIYALRIPGKGTEEFIDRAVEAHNARVAADVGVSPEVIHANPDTGLMISRFVDDAVTMTPETFPGTPGAAKRAGEALRQLHTSDKIFQFRFELFAMIDDYLGVLEKLGAQLPDGYNDVVHEAGAVREALDAHPAELAPCHCDPLCENFLDDGTRKWIIDWEYSGMNDPLWDLGDVSVEAGFSVEQDCEMMTAYFGGVPTDAQTGRMVIYKAMCDLLWTLWGLIQHANDNPAEDFWSYATGRFDRCNKLMANPDFAGHVEAVKANR